MRWGIRQRRARGRTVLAVASLLIVAGTGSCGSHNDSARSGTKVPVTPTPSAAQWRVAKATETALTKNGRLLSGPTPPEIFKHGVSCSPPADKTDLVGCSFGFDYGMMEPPWMELRLQPDGSLSKKLGSPDPVPGNKSSEQTAALLVSDDYVNHAPSRTRDYTCHRSTRVERDGTRTSTSGGGQLCTTHLRVSGKDIQRYVEFTRNGFVARDYVLDG